MALIIAELAVALALVALLLVALVVAGTHREAPSSELDVMPPTPLARFARSVLGLHVRKSPIADRPAAPPMTRSGRK